MLPGARRRQRGAAAIEFALLAAIFFTLVFGIIEVARLMYVYNTLQEVTRRAAAAAANVNPGDATALARLKQAAVFRTSAGGLALAPPETDEHIRINYLALTRAAGTNELSMTAIDPATLPGDAADNRYICMADPNAANCIRLVQVQVCDPSAPDACLPVTSQMLIPIIDLRVPLHKATTIVAAESLGYVPGGLPHP